MAADRPRLPLGYRLWWGLRYGMYFVLGPAQLGEADDPHSRLRRERQARLDAVRARRSR